MKTYSDDVRQQMLTREMVDTPPVFYSHIDGQMITFSDGQVHWLTFKERFKVKWMGLTAVELQKELRPNLTKTMELIKSTRKSGEIYPLKHNIITAPQRNCITATQPMMYLAWLRGTKEPVAQLWSEDFSKSHTTQKTRTDIIKLVKLTGTDQYQSLNALMKTFPCPEVSDNG